MLSRSFKFLLCFILFFYFNFSAVAIGIGPPTVYIDFQPNLEQSIDFYIRNNAGVESEVNIKLEGSLKDFATLESSDIMLVPIGGIVRFTVHIKLPDAIDSPGENVLAVHVTEGASRTDEGFAVVTSAVSNVIINVPYPGKYPVLSFNALDATNGSVVISYNVNNLGTEVINSVDGTVDILDGADNSIKFKGIILNPISTINPKESKSSKTLVDVSNYSFGSYPVHGIFYADSVELKADSSFRVGDKTLKIVDFTKKFEKDKISKFDINIKSIWNEPFNSVYAQVSVYDINNTKVLKSFKTFDGNVLPWQSVILSNYFDASGLAVGNYPVKVIVYFNDRIIESLGTFEIFTPLIIEVEKSKSVELPLGLSLSSWIIIGSVFVLVVIIFTVLNFVLLLRHKK